ncbi:protein CHUP1, chloroplastic isoform X2 [Mercurialis annua]|uniref:protein CHUP1, chloroplastic isoform X2 n=1 Tax=Mercurialis annua TaxID=3986 RepID=UPI00215E2EC1|nr:protein CHUP1, chloroplastic isoform X2 [Mercurialis annua]
MVKEKIDIRPVLLKFGLVLALSFAGFLYSRSKNRRVKSSKAPRPLRPSGHVVEDNGTAEMKKTPSPRSNPFISVDKHEDASAPKVAADMVVLAPSGRYNGDKDGYLLPEFNDLVNEFDVNSTSAGISPKKDVESPRSDTGTPRAARNMEKNDHDQEIRHLKTLVRMLREREKNLEFQLLEFYGLKEQETAMMELQNRLKISNMEIKLFTLKIESLQADNQRLQAQVTDHAKIVAELDAARSKIKLLKKRLKSETEQNKEHIISLRKRVGRLQEEEHKAATNDSDIKLKLQKLGDLEAETEDLRKSNLRLNSENSELARQLDSAKILANSVLEDPETEALRELNDKLKHENENLTRDVEQLRADRCNDCEELVYLRWINACLRFELRNFQPAHGKTVARDLSKSLSPKSEEIAKQLILEYANTEETGANGINIMDFESDQWSSSHSSDVIDSGDFDDSAGSPKTSTSRKINFFNKLRKLIRGKDIHHHQNHGSVDKSVEAEDSDSPYGSSSISTTTDAASDRHLNRLHSVSLDLSRRSAYIKNPKMDEMKEMGIGRRNSDVGPKRFLSGRYTTRHLSPENQPEQGSFSTERSELLKFAEVLKDSDSITRASHKKSASVGSFGSFHRTTSH